MKRRINGVLAAMVSAALVTAGMPLSAANAEIIIDHNCRGIDKGYYFEIENSDKDSQPMLMLNPGGSFDCEWDNDEGFSAVRGLRFAAPAEYSKLGKMNVKYWKRLDIKAISSTEKGYVRFGIRVRNSRGDVFDILEVDTSENGKSIAEKDERFEKIGSIVSKEIMNDQMWYGPVEGDTFDVPYTVYARENEDKTSHTYVFRRDDPLKVNNDVEDSRRIVLCDKLDYLADMGFGIGEITDIDLFLETSYSKGEACIQNYDISVENMPEIAPDEYEDAEAPISVKNYEYGVRTGYYYGTSGFGDEGIMEVQKPSLFKAEWSSQRSQENYDRGPLFERGKQYERGQSYKAVTGSTVDYSMIVEAKGAYSVSTCAYFVGPDTYERYYESGVHIVDAVSGWDGVPFSLGASDTITVDGIDYDVYYAPHSIVGTGKPIAYEEYYFVSGNAAANGANGKVTVKHDMKPFMDYVCDKGMTLGTPDRIVVQLNGCSSTGNAELVKNEMTVPDFIEDGKEYEKLTKKVELDTIMGRSYTVADNNHYNIRGYAAKMEGYSDDRIFCTWTNPATDIWLPSGTGLNHAFFAGLNGYSGYKGSDDIIIDYSMDMGELSDKGDDSKWVVGCYITCINEDAVKDHTLSGEHTGCNILLADAYEGGLDNVLNMSDLNYNNSEELGVIESDGVKYDASIAYVNRKDAQLAWEDDTSFIVLKRQEQLKASGSDDVQDGYKRYANTVNASDIVRQVNKLGYKTGDIINACFTLCANDNSGRAVINSAGVKYVPGEKVTYTEEDLKKLTDFILGRKTELAEGTDYDLNGDGVWDTFDLCSMRRSIAEK